MDSLEVQVFLALVQENTRAGSRLTDEEVDELAKKARHIAQRWENLRTKRKVDHLTDMGINLDPDDEPKKKR